MVNYQSTSWGDNYGKSKEQSDIDLHRLLES